MINLNDDYDRFDEENEIALNRSLGIDDNREGSGWNEQDWHTPENSPNPVRKPYVKPSVTPVEPTQRPRSTIEPYNLFCDFCEKRLAPHPDGPAWRYCKFGGNHL